ncbi:MAG: gluconate 2-dehydrogenase subunit 3 family protein [Bryobacteraceae bacterium]
MSEAIPGKIRRRRFLNAVAAATAATPAAVAQEAGRRRAPNPDRASAPADPSPYPTLAVSATGDIAAPATLFLSDAQFTALRRLAELLTPAIPPRPGAIEAGVPEFLDFLISQDPARQHTYRPGLDALNRAAQRTSGKPFADLDDSQAAAFLAPLNQPWSSDPITDPIAALLHQAKRDVRQATVNSREYAASGAPPAGRRGFGNQYWYPLD